MKKFVSIMLCVVLMVIFVGCSDKTDKSWSKTYYDGNEIDGYVKADYNVCSTMPKENNLGGIKMYIDGVLENVIEDKSFQAIVNDNGNKWLVGLVSNTEAQMSDFMKYFDEEIRIFGVYYGYSDRYSMPQILCTRFSLPSTGECHHILEYTTNGKNFIQGAEEVYIKMGKELNGNYVAPSSPKISLEEYNQLTEGMSFSEVSAIIGSEGKFEKSYTDSDVYSWEGEGASNAVAMIAFSDGKLKNKSQYGLE